MSSGRACSMMWIGRYGSDSGRGRIAVFGQKRSKRFVRKSRPKQTLENAVTFV